ncbi:farnesyl diphosphate synthase [Lactarius hatsudake]|nr:farnesyl diphosphate synthase [Lactarius hatsudake]
MPSTPSLATSVPHQPSHRRALSSTGTVTNAVARDQFELLYPNIREFLLSQFTAHSMPQDALEYFTKCLDHNTFSGGGKYKTGLLVVEAAEAFKGRQLNDSEYEKAAMLGWAIVFVLTTRGQLHSYFMVSDNIVDQVEMSHRKQSWHCVEGVGLKAINDALLVEGAVFQLVREHFRNEPYYIDLLELIHETRHPSFFRNPVPDVRREFHLNSAIINSRLTFKLIGARSHTLRSQRAAKIYKAAIYSYYLPMALSMIMCGFPVEKGPLDDTSYYECVLDILLPLGEYAQIQTEYLDSCTGDLPKNRSWCFDAVRTSGTPAQLATLETHFGKPERTSRLHVQTVFAEAGIDARYAQYSEDAYSRISALIDALPEWHNPSGDAILRRAAFRALLEDIHDSDE